MVLIGLWYVFQMQIVPRLAELALDLCMERPLQPLDGQREFLPATLAVELPPCLLLGFHTEAKIKSKFLIVKIEFH